MPDGQPVHAIGPDGKHYQFPAGYTSDQVHAYFGRPAASGAAAQPGTTTPTQKPTSELNPDMPTGLADWLRPLGIPGSWAEAKQMGQQRAEHPIQSAWQDIQPILTGGLGGATVGSMAKQEWRALKDPTDPMAGVRALSGFNPFSAPVTEQMDVAREQGRPGEATAGGIEGILGLMIGGGRAGEAPESATARALRYQLRRMDKQQVLEQAHANLNWHAENMQQKIRDVPLQNMRKEVGQHVQGIDAADVTASPQGPSVSTSPIKAAVDDVLNSHRTVSGLPRFNAAMDIINNLGPNEYWKNIHDAKMQIRSLWAKAAEGTPEKSALNKLSEPLEQVLGDRANEIGQSQQFNKYRELTRAYHTYESSDNAVGKLLNASSGREFFNTLRNPEVADQIKGASKDFAKYGLPADAFSKLVDDNTRLHDYVNQAKGGSSFRGKIRAIKEEPIAALAGLFGGQAIGRMAGHPVLGGMIGAMSAADLAETAGARRALVGQGLAPSKAMITSPAVQPGPPLAENVQRVMQGRMPANVGPSVDTQSVSALVGTIKDLGWKVSDKMAESMARSALDQAGGDVNKAATDLASRGKTVSGVSTPAAKAAEVSDIRSEQAASARAGTERMQPSSKGFGPKGQKGVEATESGMKLAKAAEQAAQNVFGKGYSKLDKAERADPKLVAEIEKLRKK